MRRQAAFYAEKSALVEARQKQKRPANGWPSIAASLNRNAEFWWAVQVSNLIV
jgi:hypothetical protein